MNSLMSLRLFYNTLRPLPSGQGMVFVMGMPKSGTTAIAQLLGATTQQKVCSDPFYILDSKNIVFREALFSGQMPLTELWSKYRHIFAGAIIKDPNFPLLLPDVKALFPEAKIVSLIRDPRDNIRSILNRLGLPGLPEKVNLDAFNVPNTWRNVLIGRHPDICGNNYIEVLAWRWRLSAEAFVKFDNMVDAQVGYEDFCSNKCPTIYALANKLGYSELAGIESLVDVQYQPRGDRSISWVDFFGPDQLAVIEEITGPILERFGYAIKT